MWPPPASSAERMNPMTRLVAVAIDKDRGSQIALKWAADNLLVRGQTVILVHVRQKQSSSGLSTSPSLASPCSNNSFLSLCMLSSHLMEFQLKLIHHVSYLWCRASGV